ncbi:MAG: hypothetical protein LBS28_02740 [Streptococcaceae bacterium]|jgi:hypothetical protein|nr:hypothetical protein [Streptococcaceae bacterium]
MRRLLPVGKLKYCVYLLIIIQGILLATLTSCFLDQKYKNTWNSYPNNGEYLYISQVSSVHEEKVSQYLLSEAIKQSLFLVRIENDQECGISSKIKIGVEGAFQSNEAEFHFLDQTLLDFHKLMTLFQSKNIKSTLGVAKGSAYCVGELSCLRFGTKVVIEKLSQLIKETHTVNGTYRVVGWKSDQQKQAFIDQLAQMIGNSDKSFLFAQSGNYVNDPFLLKILIAFILLAGFVLLILLMVLAAQTLGSLGKFILLGWSKMSVVYSLFQPFVLVSIGFLPFSVLLGYWLLGTVPFSYSLLSFFILTGMANVFFLLLLCTLVSGILLLIRPIDAIHQRIPQKILYAFGISTYLLIGIGLIVTSSYMDNFFQEWIDNRELYKKWEKVSNYHILGDLSFEKDASSAMGGAKQFDLKFYRWYQAIANRKGVYLIHTMHIDEKILHLWRENQVYDYIPEESFWTYSVSANYLSQLNVSLSKQTLEEVTRGVRLYLLPSNLKGSKRQNMVNYLQESTLKGLQKDDIPTNFNQNQQFCFLNYTPTKGIFHWSTEKATEKITKAPIIYVMTPQNMTFRESESLYSIGLENNYLKFVDHKTMEQCTEEHFLQKFELSKKKMKFIGIWEYIDGLQKDLLTTTQLLGGIFLFLMLLAVALLLTLAGVFRLANQEKIYVQKFLGFGYWQTYRISIFLLASIVGLELLTVILIHSRLGMIFLGMVGVIQFFVLWKYVTRNEIKQLISYFKE